MSNVTDEHCAQIIQTYEPVQQNRSLGILGIDGRSEINYKGLVRKSKQKYLGIEIKVTV